jgi:hypothetical protein
VVPHPYLVLLCRSPSPLSPEPAPTTAQPGPVVPVALVAHARKVAVDHYTHTGNAVDTSTLRARQSSSHVALIYRHGNQECERDIADAMIVKAMKRGSGRKGHVAGTDG